MFGLKNIKRKLVIDIAFIGLAVSCVLVAIYLDTPLTYVVSANTEQVYVQILKPGVSQWYLDAVYVRCSCDGKKHSFSGVIRIRSPVKIVIERISGGPMRISVKNATGDEDQIVASLHNEENNTDIYANGCLFVSIENLSERALNGETIVLAINGYVEVGREVGHETLGSVPVLKSGSVRLIGRTILGGAIYDAGSIVLNTGDQFSVKNPKTGKGIVVADHNPGLNAVAYTLGERAYVRRFGTIGYKVGTSLWIRFEKDPIIKTLFASFFFIMGTLATWRRWWRESHDKNKCDD